MTESSPAIPIGWTWDTTWHNWLNYDDVTGTPSTSVICTVIIYCHRFIQIRNILKIEFIFNFPRKQLKDDKLCTGIMVVFICRSQCITLWWRHKICTGIRGTGFCFLSSQIIEMCYGRIFKLLFLCQLCSQRMWNLDGRLYHTVIELQFYTHKDLQNYIYTDLFWKNWIITTQKQQLGFMFTQLANISHTTICNLTTNC